MCVEDNPTLDSLAERTDIKWEYDTLYNSMELKHPHILIGSNQGKGDYFKEGIKQDFHIFEVFAKKEISVPWPRPDNKPGDLWLNINDNWGYCEKDKNFKDPVEMRDLVLSNILRNSNTLFNYGPTETGFIAPDHLDVGRQIGKLLEPFREVLFATRSKLVEDWGGIVQNRITGDEYVIILTPSELIEISTDEAYDALWIVGSAENLEFGQNSLKIFKNSAPSLLKLKAKK